MATGVGGRIVHMHMCVRECRHVFVYVCVSSHVCACCGGGWIRGQLVRISSLLHVGSMDIKLRCQAWWLAPLPTYPTGPQLQFYLDICGS